MDQMKQRFVNAVASRLSAAPDGTAKAELVEELSDNLYQRFEEMTAAGMDESAAFDAALDDLGDTGELVDYLKSLAPDEGLPRPEPAPGNDEDQAWSGMDDLLGDVNDIVSAAMEQAGAALSQAKDALKKAAQKGGWRSADGSFELHVDIRDDDHGAHPYDEDREDVLDDEEAPEHEGGVSYSFGFDKAKGGFFVQRDGWDGESVPAGGLRGIDVQVSGDVTVRLSGDDADEIRLDGDTGKLEVRVTDRGVLAIRQGRTAASSFFFQRGLDAADVELYLPRRRFEFLQVSTASGDVELGGIFGDALRVNRAGGHRQRGYPAGRPSGAREAPHRQRRRGALRLLPDGGAHHRLRRHPDGDRHPPSVRRPHQQVRRLRPPGAGRHALHRGVPDHQRRVPLPPAPDPHQRRRPLSGRRGKPADDELHQRRPDAGSILSTKFLYNFKTKRRIFSSGRCIIAS